MGTGLFGYRIDSDFPLSRCREFGADRGSLRLRRSDGPLAPVGEIVAIDDSYFLSAVAVDGSALVVVDRVTGVWRLEPESGEISLDPIGTPDACEHRLAATIIPLLLAERGDLALHAAAVLDDDGAAILVCGPPGRGKSTLAAALALRGWAVLSEDGVVVSDLSGVACAWPGGAGVRLGGPARVALLDPAVVPDGRPGLPGRPAPTAKVTGLVDLRSVVAPAPVRAVVLLGTRTGGSAPAEAHAIEPAAAVAELVPHAIFAGRRGLPAALRGCGDLAGRVPVLCGSVPDDLAGVEAHAETLMTRVPPRTSCLTGRPAVGSPRQ